MRYYLGFYRTDVSSFLLVGRRLVRYIFRKIVSCWITIPIITPTNGGRVEHTDLLEVAERLVMSVSCHFGPKSTTFSWWSSCFSPAMILRVTPAGTQFLKFQSCQEDHRGQAEKLN
ncbi:hypothetical protein CRM22_006064 [Opisthorchis felineus]|uniref:Uncharacterized protein n=1 Tax=Opisthorchis felineus TaxID=147828 RepID=A0A4S2LMY0_OPIFE|nr:hypothetical protein CRM22_006064 [Opisthorchis felineus]